MSKELKITKVKELCDCFHWTSVIERSVKKRQKKKIKRVFWYTEDLNPPPFIFVFKLGNEI